jgi:excisionase family DNA binding protein
MIEQMFSEKEASDILSVSVSALRKWRYKGLLPYYKLCGGPVRFSESQLSEIMKAPCCRLNGLS